jgi:quercetin dioxygenase-like cupin family protein
MDATSAGTVGARGTGTEEHPLVNPVTGERLVFRKRAADTGGELLEFMILMAPGGFIATPHVHPNAEERFEVAGAPVMIQAGRSRRLYEPGEVAVVPPGVPHNWWNPSDRESATLIQLRPAFDMETLFETMFGLAADGRVNRKGLPNPLQMMVLARAYQREVIPTAPLLWIVRPMSLILAPIGRRLGYHARYHRYSGPAPSVASAASPRDSAGASRP